MTYTTEEYFDGVAYRITEPFELSAIIWRAPFPDQPIEIYAYYMHREIIKSCKVEVDLQFFKENKEEVFRSLYNLRKKKYEEANKNNPYFRSNQ